jgi:hypothetical protein
MKPYHLVKTILLFSTAALLILPGCTHHTGLLRKLDTKQDERTREILQSAKVANEAGRQRVQMSDTNAVTDALIAYDLSASFLRRGQNIIGLPIADQTQVVMDLLSKNRSLREAAEDHERSRVAQEQKWAADRAQLEQKLLEMGAKYEAEKNASIVKRIWHWTISTFGIGGLIALCIFCPAAIPIITRIVGWVVSKFPALAGALGVVATKSFDAVVRGVQRTKSEWGSQDGDPKETLEANLSREMDHDHKLLVACRLPVVKKDLALRAAAA